MILSLLSLLDLGYVGPGSGLSAIGAFLALLGAVILALFGFIWYPLKRILRKNRKPRNSDEE